MVLWLILEHKHRALTLIIYKIYFCARVHIRSMTCHLAPPIANDLVRAMSLKTPCTLERSERKGKSVVVH